VASNNYMFRCIMVAIIRLYSLKRVKNITHHYTQTTHHPICFVPHRKDLILHALKHTLSSQ